MLTKIKEYLFLTLKPGGFKAAFYWFSKRIFRVDFYGFFSISLTESVKISNDNYQLITVSNLKELAAIPEDLISIFDKKSDSTVKNRITKGGHFYALVDSGKPISQLEIYQPFPIEVDTPIDLQINIDNSFRFLGFLSTYPAYEKKGFATLLISLAMQDINKKGVSKLLTHIRLSNIKSIRAFENNGWKYMGSIITTHSGSLLKRPNSLIKTNKI